MRLLFTAFEPSGDLLAARLAREIRRRYPDSRMFAMGGEALADAGVEVLRDTVSHGVMGMPALEELKQQLAIRKQLAELMQREPFDALLPVDSPAANWAICKLFRKHRPEGKVVHLVMPQLWAWASWRIHRLRRLTDHVLCLLPFEVDWLEQRSVAGTFVGHPLFEQDDELAAPEHSEGADHAAPLPEGPSKLVVLPGSRGRELLRNLPHFLEVVRKVKQQRPGMCSVVAARTEADAEACRSIIDRVPAVDDLHLVAERTDEAILWADASLTKSGTVTLQVAARHTPQVAVYNHSRVQWNAVGRWIIATRTFTLPNLITEHLGRGRVIREFIPHFGEVEPVVQTVSPLLDDGPERQAQLEHFTAIDAVFADRAFSRDAADALERVLGIL